MRVADSQHCFELNRFRAAGLVDNSSTTRKARAAALQRGLDMAKRPHATRGVGMITLRAIGCAAVTLVVSQGSVLAIDMKITGIKINSADYVDPTELYIPPGAVFNVKCQDVRPGGLGFRWFKMRVDGVEVDCPPNQCQFSVPVNPPVAKDPMAKDSGPRVFPYFWGSA